MHFQEEKEERGGRKAGEAHRNETNKETYRVQGAFRGRCTEDQAKRQTIC